MEGLKLTAEAARFLAVMLWCSFHAVVESLLTRCRARCDMQAVRGPITHGLCKLCVLADFLWSHLPCGAWIPLPNITLIKPRPCGCKEKE